MRVEALLHFYRRRLRKHGVQEVFAGLGVGIAVALIFAVLVANGSIAGSATAAVHTVIGPASLQLRARDANGFDERLLTTVKHLPGVHNAGELLEQSATIEGPHGRRIIVDVAGADAGLTVIDGLGQTLPIPAFRDGLGLSKTSADRLGVAAPSHVFLDLNGQSTSQKVTSVLGKESAGALSQAQVALMPLEDLQQLAGLPGRITRILVQTEPGREAAVRGELQRLAGEHLLVSPADQDIALLHQALRPSDLASDIFAGVALMIGLLLAFDAILLTVPERRRMIASLRLEGARPTAIVQMVLFEALCLGIGASVVGVAAGYALSIGVFHESSGYLKEAFTLGTGTVVEVQPLLLSVFAGILVTCLASSVPLFDLRRKRPLDAVYFESGTSNHALDSNVQLRLGLVSVALVIFTVAVLELRPSLVLAACAALVLATVLAVPLAFSAALYAAGAFASRFEAFTVLPVAVSALRATPLRSLVLAATGAVALFGSVALGGSRDDLLRGIARFTTNYVGSADIWVVNPDDNQAVNSFSPESYSAQIARLPGVVGVAPFQGSYFDIGNRRVWIIAWPASSNLAVLRDQIISGNPATAVARLRQGNWITISQQIADERHVRVGDALTLPSPAGSIRVRIAATTTNFGWSPGAVLMTTANYNRGWGTTKPTALGITLKPGTNTEQARLAITSLLGHDTGLTVLTARARGARINAAARDGLNQLNEISALLIIAAILAMATALTAAIWERRKTLAEKRLDGAKRYRLRRILIVEASLMLSSGCLPGVLAGIYGQFVLDIYLKRATGFPVESVATNWRPLEILLVVIVPVLVIIVTPGWLASRVPSTLALDD